MHWLKRVLGNLPSTANSSKRLSTWDQPSVPTFLVMNLSPLRARAAPDLALSTLSNFLDEVMRLSSCDTCRSRTDSEEGRFSRRLASSAVSGSPPLMFWTDTVSSRTSNVISTKSSSSWSLNLALFLLLFLLDVTNGPLMGPLKPTRVLLLPVLDVSDHVSCCCSNWISIDHVLFKLVNIMIYIKQMNEQLHGLNWQGWLRIRCDDLCTSCEAWVRLLLCWEYIYRERERWKLRVREVKNGGSNERWKRRMWTISE